MAAVSSLVINRYGEITIITHSDPGGWLLGIGPSFPIVGMTNPSNGSPFFRTDFNVWYVWDASLGSWTISGLDAIFSGLTKITVGSVEPASPTEGDLWVDTA